MSPCSLLPCTALHFTCRELQCNRLTGVIPGLPFKQYEMRCNIGGYNDRSSCNTTRTLQPNKFSCPLPRGADICISSATTPEGIGCASADISPEQLAGWKEFFHDTGGEGWGTNPGDCDRSAKVDPCACTGPYYSPPTTGVKCEGGDIVEIHLGKNKLSGSIGEGLSKLTKLRVLDLSGDDLTGTIPVSLSKLIVLKRLSLNCNSLDGMIPDLPFAQYEQCAVGGPKSKAVCTNQSLSTNSFKCPLPTSAGACASCS